MPYRCIHHLPLHPLTKFLCAISGDPRLNRHTLGDSNSGAHGARVPPRPRTCVPVEPAVPAYLRARTPAHNYVSLKKS